MSAAINNRTVYADVLKIHGNCLEFKDIILQLSNISLFSTENIAPSAFPVWSILLIIAGVILAAFTQWVFAIALVASGTIWFISWNRDTAAKKKLKRLTIITNSGNSFSIVFNDAEFLQRVTGVLTNIIADPAEYGDITINIRGNSFYDSSRVIETVNDTSTNMQGR